MKNAFFPKKGAIRKKILTIVDKVLFVMKIIGNRKSLCKKGLVKIIE
jgi:hypothetical protein